MQRHQRCAMQRASHTVTDVTLRETIHDLRNLFGIVASARHMLDDNPTGERRTLLLDAIEDAAFRGDRLTTAMLSQAVPNPGASVDLNAHLRGLEPLLRAHGNGQIEISFKPCTAPLPVRLDLAGLDAAVLELVSNACSAVVGSGAILIRTKSAGRFAQLIVADNGNGMTKVELARALTPADKPAANGTGLARIGHFAMNAQGNLRIRSRKAQGTIVCVTLPLGTDITGAATADTPAKMQCDTEEISDEQRRPIAA
ncbi:HAMP domain-containing sensor histidine kinase [Sphingobium sp. H39-3-25]|uniref:ATP-binding protein n=1 Tax=Sphingobium arseniciresistens TaxID=3030834 RepID=UPI0023B9F35D|nr:HAMP domain-containing sensor histidine kinase [Sphingobium arseniciresistens]